MSRGKVPHIVEHVERYTDNYTLPQTEAEATFLNGDGNHFCRVNHLGVLVDAPRPLRGVHVSWVEGASRMVELASRTRSTIALSGLDLDAGHHLDLPSTIGLLRC